MFVVVTIVALTLLNMGLAEAGPSAEEGMITARVLFRGPVPPPTVMDVNRDPETCGPTAAVQSVVVQPSSGGLRNAVVSIDGFQAEEMGQRLTTPVVLSNFECRFVPHVSAVRTGALLEIHNQDPIMHNTHIKDETRTWINIAMVPNVRPILKKVAKAGLYRVRCDAHKFMQGYVVAFDHPLFAVSDEEGYARIRHVPAGTHEISVWHETLGELRSRVTVPANGEAIVTFQFPGDADSQVRPGRK